MVFKKPDGLLDTPTTPQNSLPKKKQQIVDPINSKVWSIFFKLFSSMWDVLVAWKLNAFCISIEQMVGWFGQIGGNPKIVQI